MKTRHKKHKLPLQWASVAAQYGLLGELDIKVRHSSRLRMKALMFRTNAGLRAFWKDRLKRDELCRFTRGVVSGLMTAHERVAPDGRIKDQYMTVDARYFCVMGLIAGSVNMEIIAHESVHAAFAYAKRVHHKNLWHGALNHDEENVCYPAGRIAVTLNAWCHKRGYYSRRKREKK